MTTKRNLNSIIGGAILILFGLLALFGHLFRGVNHWSAFWPLLIIGFGSLFFVGMLLGGKSTAGLALPGSITTIIGLILLVQNLTNYWESWAYAWALFVAAVGLGNFLLGTISENEAYRQSGRRLAIIGLILFVLFGAFFESLIFTDSPLQRIGKWILPVVLILVGIFITLTRASLLGTPKQETPITRERS